MGMEETNTTAVAADASGSQTIPPPEEPPKLEEIVTEDVLQEIINGYNPKLDLVSWQAQPGSKIGDNYMSIMYAVELDLADKENKGTMEKLHVMLKTIPRSAMRLEMINEMKAFGKEATIYQKVLPIFVGTQRERKIPKTDLFSAWPTCYAAHLDGKTDFLAMENLKVAGYKMGSRVDGLDFNHCCGVLRNLAKYHAISYVKYGGSRDKIVEDFPILNENMFSSDSQLAQMQQQFFAQSFKSQAETLRGLGEELGASRLEKLSKANFSTLLGKMLKDDVECAVVSHGDCWVNNMLFKYTENDTEDRCPVSIKLIDFQLASATSRLVDVFYFLMTSGKVDVLNTREQDLLMNYYTEFTSFTEKLGVNTADKGLTWDNFRKEADKYRLYGVCMGILLAPMMAADSADIPDLDSYTKEDFENGEEAMDKFYKDVKTGIATQKTKNIVLKHLPRCVNADEFL